MRVGIVGAGIAGLACAAALRAAGYEPTLFDKARGAGGRMSTRRIDAHGGPLAFDHGATHFTARSAAFKALVAEWETAGLAARWPAGGRDAWVGTPSMNAPLKAYGAPHDIRRSSMVTALTRSSAGWTIHSERSRYGPFDAVAVAIPAEQAAPLLSLHDFSMARAAMAIRSHPIWSAMFAFARPIDGLPDMVRGKNTVTLAVRNNSRPGRGGMESWIVQASWQWSEAHLTRPANEICDALLAALAAESGATIPEPVHYDAHRWLFAQPSGRDPILLWNDAIGLGACGDWLAHGFVEAAWESGNALGEAMARSLAAGEAPTTDRESEAGREIRSGFSDQPCP